MILKFGHGIQAVCDVSALLRRIAFLVLKLKNCKKQTRHFRSSPAYFSAALMYIFGVKLRRATGAPSRAWVVRISKDENLENCFFLRSRCSFLCDM